MHHKYMASSSLADEALWQQGHHADDNGLVRQQSRRHGCAAAPCRAVRSVFSFGSALIVFALTTTATMLLHLTTGSLLAGAEALPVLAYNQIIAAAADQMPLRFLQRNKRDCAIIQLPAGVSGLKSDEDGTLVICQPPSETAEAAAAKKPAGGGDSSAPPAPAPAPAPPADPAPPKPATKSQPANSDFDFKRQPQKNPFKKRINDKSVGQK